MSKVDKTKFKELKKKFENWSAFSFESTAESELDDVIEEIEEMKYKLECEISDFARHLESLAKEIFPEN